MNMETDIQLNDSLIIGKGRDRVCYEHPRLKNLCIKISISNDKQSKREVSYFKFLQKTSKNLSHISAFRGKTNTNLGLGYTFDVVRDHDGKISKTLRQCLESRIFSIESIRPEINDLKEYLISNKICVRDISPSNISCQITPHGTNLFIIDGVSNSNINPLTIRLQSLINASIDKAWRGLNRKLVRIENALNGTDK